ncbi:Ig-like domain-containing protein [Paenibacillus rubinfantis]|uniref:Ig-like domain-containing protein n=1 Tax=Paenibacillus rubinfantis TaxID=1720296 RepID=UPI000B77BF5E|nr:SwmB domain-containing protein [Paenibacillus rubinfantis]
MKKRASAVIAILLAANLFGGALAGAASGVTASFTNLSSKTAVAASSMLGGAVKVSPGDGDRGVVINTSIKIEFEKRVTFTSQDIAITDMSSDTLYGEIQLRPASGVNQDYHELNLTLPTLAYGKEYKISIPAGTFIEVDGNNPLPIMEWTFTTVSSGNIAPTATAFTPNNANVTLAAGNLLTLSATFSEPIEASSGRILINRVSDNKTIETIAATSVSYPDPADRTKIQFTATKLSGGERYYVLIENTAFRDADWTPYAGISNANQWTFTVKGSPVTVTQYTPTGSGVNPQAALQINYSRNVYPVSGNITLKTGSTTQRTISVTSPEVTGGDSRTIVIQPATALSMNTTYTVEVPAGVFVDSDNNPAPAANWTFTTGTTTSTTLAVSSLSPADRSTNHPVAGNLIVTFNRSIALNNASGISLYKQGTATSVPATVQVNPSNNRQLIIDPTSNLQEGSTYYVNIAPGAVLDLAAGGTSFGGLTGSSSWTFETVSADNTAPTLQSATMYSNSVIQLLYNESLDSSISLLTSSFSVTVNGETRRLSNAYVSDNSAYVTLETGVAVGQKVTIAYTGNSVRPIRDLAGNAVASFSSREVTNGVDSVLPKPKDGYVSGSTLVLIFSDTLKSVSSYAYQQFSVTADGYSKGINSISQSGTTVTLYLSSSVSNGEIVKVSYSPESYPLEDYRGQSIPGFSDYFVRNYNDTRPPEFAGVEGSGNKLVLTYNEALRTTSVPLKSQFSVLVNNSPVYVTNVEIVGSQVYLTLASSFTQTQAVTLSYVSGVGGIADLNGNLAGYINLQPVTYSTITEGIRSAIVRGDTLTVTYNTSLMALSYIPVNQFYVTVDQTNRGLQSASISGDTLTLKLTSAVTPTQTVKLSYMTGAAPLYDYLGNILKSYSDMPVQNLTGTGTGTPGTGGVNGQPSYLTALAAADYGKAGFILGTGAAQVSGGSTQNGQIVNKYTLDNGKLQESFKYLANNNVNSRMLVFEVPSSEKAALVAAPMAGFMDLYNSGKTGSFAVKYGNVLYEVPVEKIPYAELSRSLMADTLNSVNLLVELETVSRNQLPSAGATGSVTITPLADPVQVSVSAFNTSSPQNDVDVSHKGQIHYRLSGQASVADQASLVQYDVSNRTLAHLPSSTTGSGGMLLFEGTTSGNALIGPVIGYSYFTDTTKHWAKNDIAELTNKLIVGPRSSGSNFEPEKNITRAEFAVFIAKGLGLAGDETNARRFPDVSSGTTAAYIGAAAKAGIINGNADGTFKPNSNITREQMALMMVRAMEYAGYDTSMNGASTATLTKFKDAAKIQSKDTVAKAVKEGIIQGVSTNTFQPQGNATRAQAAVMLKRVLDKLNYI